MKGELFMKKIDKEKKKKVIKIVKYVAIVICAVALIATLIYFGVKAYGNYKEICG